MKRFAKKILYFMGLKRTYAFIAKKYNDAYWKERIVKGKKEEKIYYVIRRQDDVGLFSYFNTFIGSIKKAVDAGYIPVIDLMTYENTYLCRKEIGKINAWDVYFNQPCNVLLENIKKSKRILSSGEAEKICPNDSDECFNIESETFKMWKKIVKTYIEYSEESKKQIENSWFELFNKEDKILGVMCRGTDYTDLRPRMHPIQPDVEEVIEKAKELIEKNKYTKIFLATEDRKNWNAFKKVFGDKVVRNTENFVDYKPGCRISKSLPDSTDGRIAIGMEYLVSIAILAKCNAFIGGRTSGSVAVMLLSEGFEYYYLWDKGRY